MFERIVVPLDGTPLARRALPYAVEIGKQFRSEMLLVRVVKSAPLVLSGFDGPAAVEIIAEAAQRADRRNLSKASRYLDAARRSLEAQGLKVGTYTVLGAPGEEILKLCKEKKASLVVMTTHGRAGLRRAWIGSVADEIVRSSVVPVMVIRPEQGAG